MLPDLTPLRSRLSTLVRRIRRWALLLLVTIGAIGLVNAPLWARSPLLLRWTELDVARSSGISGLAWQGSDGDQEFFLAVHDTKGDRARTALYRLSQVQWGDRPPRGRSSLAWPPDAELPIDLEAISAIPGTGDYLAVTSRGRAYRLSALENGSSIAEVFLNPDPRSLAGELTVRAVFNLPPTPEPDRDIETLRIVRWGDRLAILFADRGGQGRPATLHWGWFDPASNAIALQGSTPVTGPLDLATQRSLSDLVYLADGRLLGLATIDGGDQGPFQSALYWVGSLTWVEGQWVWQPVDRPQNLIQAGNHKIEAIALAPEPNATRLLLATDDEDLGMAIAFIPLQSLGSP